MKQLQIKFITLLFLLSLLGFNSCKNKDIESSILKQHAEEVYENTTYADYTPKRIKYLIVHCSATDPKYPWSIEKLKQFFTNPKPKGNGWDKYGYHWYITQNGIPQEMTNLDCDDYIQYSELTNNATGYNSTSIAICLEGGSHLVNKKLIDQDNFTVKQKESLSHLIAYYKSKYPWIEVIPHRSVSTTGKSCPVLNLDNILKEIK